MPPGSFLAVIATATQSRAALMPVPAEMAAGSLLLYTGRLYHGGGANTSDGWRLGLSLQHPASWLTQSSNQFLECPPAIVAD